MHGGITMKVEDIIFRGRTENGEWIYGDLSRFPNGKVCIESHPFYFDVDPNTIGQYTGMKDKDGRKIFEGDLLDRNGKTYEVHWCNAGVYILSPEKPEDFFEFNAVIGLPNWVSEECKVVGNVYEGQTTLFPEDG